MEEKVDRDTRQPLQHGMIQVTLPVLPEQDFHRTPHDHPTENQETLTQPLNECRRLDGAQQTAQPEAAGEYAQSERECEASNSQAAAKVPLALRMRATKVLVNCIGRVGMSVSSGTRGTSTMRRLATSCAPTTETAV